MGVHDYHLDLPTYHPDQIWVDGCGECEKRADTLPLSLGWLDGPNSLKAVVRANDWELDPDNDMHVSNAEARLFRYINTVRLALGRAGFMVVPIGPVPAGWQS